MKVFLGTPTGIVANEWYYYTSIPILLFDIGEVIWIREGRILACGILVFGLEKNNRATIRDLSFRNSCPNARDIVVSRG